MVAANVIALIAGVVGASLPVCGSEFETIFKEECQRRGINLFVLLPRSPKLNGAVERAHRTHTGEFYEVTEGSFDLSELREELLE